MIYVTKYTKSSIFVSVFTFQVYLYAHYQVLPSPKFETLYLYAHSQVLPSPHGSRQSRKKCLTFLRWVGGGSPEERPYDVSRGQNRYVTLPLVIPNCPLKFDTL